MEQLKCFNQSSTIQNYTTMGKTQHLQTGQQADIRYEIAQLEFKAAERSLSSNWYHYKYIWTLISELKAVDERRTFFRQLSLIAEKLQIKAP